MSLALDMVQKFSEELKKNFFGFTPEAADLIVNNSWPGNIRELKTEVERTIILALEGNDRCNFIAAEGIRGRKNSNHPKCPLTEPGSDFLASLRELDGTTSGRYSPRPPTTKRKPPKSSVPTPTSLLRR